MIGTKENILQKAFILFLQKSYKSVSINDIQAEVELSRGAIYHHFKNKEEIFCQVIDHYFFPAISTLEAHIGNESDTPLLGAINRSLQNRRVFIEKLRAVTHQKVDDIYFFRLAFQAMEFYPDFKDKVGRLKQKEMDAWLAVLRRAVLKGEISSTLDLHRAAQLLMIIPEGLGISTTFGSGLSVETLRASYMHYYNLIKA